MGAGIDGKLVSIRECTDKLDCWQWVFNTI